MQPITAALIAIFGLYMVWGAFGYLYDLRPDDGAKAYYFAAGAAAIGIALIAGSKRLAAWFARGFEGDALSGDTRLSITLYRLFGLFILYVQGHAMVQLLFAMSVVNAPSEFTQYAEWKIAFRLVMMGAGVALALVPRKIDRWLSKFDPE